MQAAGATPGTPLDFLPEGLPPGSSSAAAAIHAGDPYAAAAAAAGGGKRASLKAATSAGNVLRGAEDAERMERLLQAAQRAVAAERAEAVAAEEGKVTRATSLVARLSAGQLYTGRRSQRDELPSLEVKAIQAQKEAAAMHERAQLAMQRASNAEIALAQIGATLEEERAASIVQAGVRQQQQEQVFRSAFGVVVGMQKRLRGRNVRELYNRMREYIHLLQDGAVFLKYSQNGPPHDRYVWLLEDMHTICWCETRDVQNGVLPKPTVNNSMDLKECLEITEGATTKTFVRNSYKRDAIKGAADPHKQYSTMTLKLLPSLKKDIDQILHPSDAFSVVHNANLPVDEHRSFSIVGKKRTLDLVAADNRVRDEWLWGLRMLLGHWTTTSDLANVHAQRKILGIDEKFNNEHRFLATDLLGEEFVEAELDIVRYKHGMGVTMDGANNMVLEVESCSAAEDAGLLPGDLIMIVNGTAVTVLDDGYVLPRMAVPAAITPDTDLIHMTVFRKFAASPITSPTPRFSEPDLSMRTSGGAVAPEFTDA